MLNQFVELDVSIVTYAPFMGKDIDNEDDDYDEENDEVNVESCEKQWIYDESLINWQYKRWYNCKCYTAKYYTFKFEEYILYI